MVSRPDSKVVLAVAIACALCACGRGHNDLHLTLSERLAGTWRLADGREYVPEGAPRCIDELEIVLDSLSPPGSMYSSGDLYGQGRLSWCGDERPFTLTVLIDQFRGGGPYLSYGAPRERYAAGVGKGVYAYLNPGGRESSDWLYIDFDDTFGEVDRDIIRPQNCARYVRDD